MTTARDHVSKTDITIAAIEAGVPTVVDAQTGGGVREAFIFVRSWHQILHSIAVSSPKNTFDCILDILFGAVRVLIQVKVSLNPVTKEECLAKEGPIQQRSATGRF
jgi:hypothetical protein